MKVPFFLNGFYVEKIEVSNRSLLFMEHKEFEHLYSALPSNQRPTRAKSCSHKYVNPRTLIPKHKLYLKAGGRPGPAALGLYSLVFTPNTLERSKH